MSDPFDSGVQFRIAYSLNRLVCAGNSRDFSGFRHPFNS